MATVAISRKRRGTLPDSPIYNVAIIGGGPAGLSGAITAGSEMKKVILLDSGKKVSLDGHAPILGGQIRETARIENHPGVISASGKELVEIFTAQAKRMGVEIRCPVRASSLELMDDDLKCVQTKEGDRILARAVILANGLSYRKLSPETGSDDFLGRGVKYGAMDVNPGELGMCRIGVVGAANSAGQAVLSLAQNEDAQITIFVRGKRTIHDQMSEYLIDRIKAEPRISIMQDVEVVKAIGEGKLQQVQLKHGTGDLEDFPCDHLFVFIGAMPKVNWLAGAVRTNSRGFILTGAQLGQTTDFTPLPYETSMSGVFAAGDILLDPTKRVTTAAGHGSSAVAAVHRYFIEIESGQRRLTLVRKAS